MAIYRSDQAQLTFAVEAAPGGYPELASAVTPSSGTHASLTAAHAAGSRSLTSDGWGSATALEAGDFIVIGTSATASSEIRKVQFVEGTYVNNATPMTVVVDTPLGFSHDNNTVIRVVTAVTDTPADKYITFVPGVYETVEVPDPEMAIEPRYYLGTASKRNPYQYLKGQQTYTGSVGGFVLLDGRALRFPIGKVNTTTTFINTTQGGANDPSYGAMINNVAGYKKGDIFVTIDAAWAAVPVGAKLLFTGSTTASTTSSATSEVRTHVGAESATALRLDAPLQFDHANNEYVYAIVTSAGGTTVQSNATSPLAWDSTG